MTQQTFNGVSLFAEFASTGGSGGNTANLHGVFHAIPTNGSFIQDNTVSVFVSPDGNTGAKVSIGKAMLLSALTLDTGTLTSSIQSTDKHFSDAAGTDRVRSFAATDIGSTIEPWVTYQWECSIRHWRTLLLFVPVTEVRCRG